MIPYYFMLGVPIILALLYGGTSQKVGERKKQGIVIFSFFAILLLILMLRDQTIGVDIKTYLSHFSIVDKVSPQRAEKLFGFERGFWLLNKIISAISTNENFFLAVIAIITTVPLAVLYIKESENALLTISVFLMLSNFSILFSGLRQSIALAIIAIAFTFVKKKKLVWFILLVVLAFFFHKSALIAFLIYPVYHMNITRTKMFFSVPLIVLVFIFNKEIFEFLLVFLNDLGYNYEFEETSAYMMIILFALFVLLSYIAPAEENMDKNTIGLRNLGVLSLVIQIFALASPVAMRMNYYFMMFYPILLPKVIKRALPRNMQVYQLVGVVVMLYFFFDYISGMYTGADILQLYPYKAFWE